MARAPPCPGSSVPAWVAAGARYSVAMVDRPAPDPAKLLEAWMEWERGEATPGRTMASLKTGGLRDLLEGMLGPPGGQARAEAAGDSAAGTWSPVV